MTDYSPAGFDAREALARAVVAAVEAATPVDDREAAARDAFLERTRLEIELEDAGVNRSRMSVLWSPLHEIRGVFDLMPTEGEEAVATIGDPARRRTQPRSRACASRCPTRRARATSSPRGSTPRWPSRCAAGPAQTGEAGDFYLGLVERLEGGDRDRAARHWRPRRAPRPPSFGLFLVRRARAAGHGQGGRRPRGLRAGEPLLPRRRGRPRRDLRLGLDRAPAALRPDARDRRADPARASDVDEAVAHLDADPDAGGARAARPSATGCRSSPTAPSPRWPTCTSTSPSRSGASSACSRPTNDGGIYYTGPSEDFDPTGPDVVVGARRHRGLPPVARGHDRLPRGRARPPPPGRPDGLPQRHASTAGSG